MGKLTKYIFLFSVIFILSAGMSAIAQTRDSSNIIVQSPDTTKTDTLPPKHVHKKMSKPDKAALMSAILPGLGQVTHKDVWWHVPIIYAGFGALAYGIIDQNNLYQTYRTAYHIRLNTNADTNIKVHDQFYNQISDETLLEDREFYRRNRDLMIMVSVLWYGANIIDAYVASYLRDFDISNDLSMRIQAPNIGMIGNEPVITCGLTFKLK